MNNKEELQSLIADLRGKLGDNASVELIDDDESAEQITEPQGEPGPTLPDELLAMITDAFKEAAEGVLGKGSVSVKATQISALDGSAESQGAIDALLGRFGIQRMRKPYCYHYILDSNGQPVHCDDREEVQRFMRRRGHVIAEKHLDYRGNALEITTALMVHNPMIGEEPPSPYWVTTAHMPGAGPIDGTTPHWLWHSADEAMAMHRKVVEDTRRFLAEEHRERRPSPLRRAKAAKRIAAGQDVLRRKPTKESAERWMRRIVKEAFGDMNGPEIAQVLGLPSLRRKRGAQ